MTSKEHETYMRKMKSAIKQKDLALKELQVGTNVVLSIKDGVGITSEKKEVSKKKATVKERKERYIVFEVQSKLGNYLECFSRIDLVIKNVKYKLV